MHSVYLVHGLKSVCSFRVYSVPKKYAFFLFTFVILVFSFQPSPVYLRRCPTASEVAKEETWFKVIKLIGFCPVPTLFQSINRELHPKLFGIQITYDALKFLSHLFACICPENFFNFILCTGTLLENNALAFRFTFCLQHEPSHSPA